MNLSIANQVAKYCEEIADDVFDILCSKDTNIADDDICFIEDAMSRVSSSARPDVVAALYYDIPECIVEYSNEQEDISELSVTVAVYFEDDDCSVSADNTPADCSPVGMHINIFMPEDESFFDDGPQWQSIFLEILNSVRHEFEHTIQSDFSSLVHNVDYHKIDFRPSREPLSSMAYYLVQPSEVSAHIHGYFQISSSTEDFYSKIIGLLTQYVELELISEEEEFRIFLCWKDWFLRNIYKYDSTEVSQCAK